MELHAYRRPPDDTGIGVHWSPGNPVAVGMDVIVEEWLPELRALGVSWVKLAAHQGIGELTSEMLRAGIMPVVHVQQPEPNPSVLSLVELREVDHLVDIGVRYFEFNLTPDAESTWQDQYLPPDAIELVARNALQDMEAILERGGYPGVPAACVDSDWDLLAAMAEQDSNGVLQGPVWQAVHNYSLNRPVDYPSDRGNQRGSPYTENFYNMLAAEEWDGNAWGGRSLRDINLLRLEGARPGTTIMGDWSCFRGYERSHMLARRHLGRTLPVLSTESGYIVGEAADARYAATTPRLHMAQTLEICRVMMGTSERYEPAPEYYFCTAFWLLANELLGYLDPEWEMQAWYSRHWPEGYLPIVPALKAEPKQARFSRQSRPTQESSLYPLRSNLLAQDGEKEEKQQWTWVEADVGEALTGANLRVQIEKGSGHVARLYNEGRQISAAMVGSRPELGQDVVQFSDLPAGAYTVAVEGLGARATVELSVQRTLLVKFQPSRLDDAEAASGGKAGMPSPLDLAEVPQELGARTASTVEAYDFPDADTLEWERMNLETSQPLRSESETSMTHYLFIGSMLPDVASLEAALRYAARFQPEVGTDIEAAIRCQHVTILGSLRMVPLSVEERFREAGCTVDRIGSDPAREFARRLRENKPF